MTNPNLMPGNGELTFDRRALLRSGGLAVAAIVLHNLAGCDSGKTPSESNLTPDGPIRKWENNEWHKPGNEFEAEPNNVWSFNTLDDVRIATAEEPVYNGEAQAYTDETANVCTDDNGLILEAHKERHGGKQYTSGKIDTQDTFSFAYGRLEARLKLPKGKGTWPAFWLLSANQPHTDKFSPTDEDWAKPDFYKHDGEIDIMEAYGKEPGVIEATLHTFKKVTETRIKVADASDDYHDYGIEVTPDRVTWLIDGKAYKTIKKPGNATSENWPMSGGNKFYWILNLAMGGDGGGTVDDSKSADWKLHANEVRFYKHISNK